MLFISADLFSQRRTTQVRSYTRKDGTYVSSHSRSYKAGKSTSGGSYHLSSSDYNSDKPSIESELFAYAPNAKGKYEEIDDATNKEAQDFYIEAHILRYEGNILDINPVSRDNLSSGVKHQFSKEFIPGDIALELVSDYGWSLRDGTLSKTFYDFSRDKEPQYLTRKKEKIKISLPK